MNVFFQELKQYRRSAIVWIIALVAISALYTTMFPAFFEDVGTIQEVLKNMPVTFRKLFAVDDVTAFAGFMGLVINLTALAAAVQAMNIGTDVISKEISDKTADFIFTKPKSRFSILSQKMLAALLVILFTFTVYAFLTWIYIQIVISEPILLNNYLRAVSVILLVQLFFLSLGFLFGAAIPRIRSVIAVSLPVVFGLYVFGLLDTIVGEDIIKYFTPFKMQDVQNLSSGGAFNNASVIYYVGLVLLFTVAAIVIYSKKDIHTV